MEAPRTKPFGPARIIALALMSAAVLAGTPGVDGIPSVAIPEPALASSASTWP